MSPPLGESKWTGVGSLMGGAALCLLASILVAGGEDSTASLLVGLIAGAGVGVLALLALAAVGRLYWLGSPKLRGASAGGVTAMGAGVGMAVNAFLHGASADVEVAVLAALAGTLAPMIAVWPLVVKKTRAWRTGER